LARQRRLLIHIERAKRLIHLMTAEIAPSRTAESPRDILFAPDVPPLNVGELRLWRLWAMSTHQHRSTPAYEVIINKAHLLIEDEMPQCLLDFCAHKAGYDVVIERWKQGDYTEHLSVVRHPGDALLDYLQRSFIELKRKQASEIDATQGKTARR
jgi:hypothetical protein